MRCKICDLFSEINPGEFFRLLFTHLAATIAFPTAELAMLFHKTTPILTVVDKTKNLNPCWGLGFGMLLELGLCCDDGDLTGSVQDLVGGESSCDRDSDGLGGVPSDLGDLLEINALHDGLIVRSSLLLLVGLDHLNLDSAVAEQHGLVLS